MVGKNVSRRVFLSAAGASVLTAALARPAASTSLVEDADVVVIGSGYAGSVAALRLSQAGVSTLVLERGRRWEVTSAGDTFCTGARPDGRAAWLSTSSPVLTGNVPRYTGVLQAVAGAGIVCLAGAGVGGGSLVNNGVMMQPEEADFFRSFGERVAYPEMASTWYPRARALIGASPIPDDVLASTAYANARQAQSELAGAGIETIRPDIAVDWSVVRQEIAGKAVPSLIDGQSIFGVNSGAKLSVDRTILARAEASGRVHVRELSSVEALHKTATGFQITVRQIDTAGATVREYKVGARRVILAAGSLNTTRLLLRGRAEGTIPHLPSTLGTTWGTGGDGIVLFGGLPRPQPAVGGPAHIVGRYRSTSGLPVSLLNFPLGVPIIDAFARESMAVGHVPPVGHLVRNWSGGVVPVWNPLDPGVRAGRHAMGELVGKIDAALPDRSALLSSQLLTSHPLGGVVLSDLTDQAGQVRGVDGLFVMDSSLIPGASGGVPPALTVVALADRCVSTALEHGHFGPVSAPLSVATEGTQS
ncbi:GMC family oxidoreductase [Oerskovia turbata]|uniref:Cholesterol oxidase n=1 Tax=Oerskovia turbata TaxID=1713 RepID=A0A4Q1KNS3_9CELL|nr:GMC oxidoreductase [Oerskovia turbata]RXR23098.1 GMC family oxidoreductase [Oerskovia turbata]RXR31703.1 GMC family oxidoreductase [Oerskovia turbata]TGJ97239.1 GMC family oxidoreductase [Actinotalea fermentans ATCC 43279 = JCM 9966 = DSM 3133]